ncbi:hypothetical protein HPP92_022365 [Vanilla planifolia]|uniref:Uncharacterized protein n=1 Tax=Vanilla planifolia TaxID=51239 RepID=A0A835UDG9_VANPL|nr:hypothetical protein HPP92_022365 [Vanilla planifolia]
MGKAGRWLRGLLSGKKVEEEGRAAENQPFKEKKWDFIKSFREKDKGRAQRNSLCHVWRRWRKLFRSSGSGLTGTTGKPT